MQKQAVCSICGLPSRSSFFQYFLISVYSKGILHAKQMFVYELASVSVTVANVTFKNKHWNFSFQFWRQTVLADLMVLSGWWSTPCGSNTTQPPFCFFLLARNASEKWGKLACIGNATPCFKPKSLGHECWVLYCWSFRKREKLPTFASETLIIQKTFINAAFQILNEDSDPISTQRCGNGNQWRLSETCPFHSASDACPRIHCGDYISGSLAAK